MYHLIRVATLTVLLSDLVWNIKFNIFLAKTTILKEYYWEFYWEFHITMFSIIRILKDPGKIVMFFSAFEASTGKKLEKKHGKI